MFIIILNLINLFLLLQTAFSLFFLFLHQSFRWTIKPNEVQKRSHSNSFHLSMTTPKHKQSIFQPNKTNFLLSCPFGCVFPRIYRLMCLKRKPTNLTLNGYTLKEKKEKFMKKNQNLPSTFRFKMDSLRILFFLFLFQPQQGTGLQDRVTQSICRASDTISAYINHIGSARPPPGTCWGGGFVARLQNTSCQSAESDRRQTWEEQVFLQWHAGDSGCGI